mmetsp:Transcript_35068/g.40572  ORF Transcript_35068/g.40572 Transcript_35068/m.40572 type:complete len:183 (+) Transcript_35068:280-828(+)
MRDVEIFICLRIDMAWRMHYVWEAEEEDSVKEALSIGQKLLDIATEVYPKSEDTTRDIKDFVLDLSLEVGQWDDAAALLARFNDDITEESLWAAVLIYFKSRGPDSKATRKALERATRINPHVFSLLVGERLLADGEVERCRAEGASHFFKMVNGSELQIMLQCTSTTTRNILFKSPLSSNG